MYLFNIYCFRVEGQTQLTNLNNDVFMLTPPPSSIIKQVNHHHNHKFDENMILQKDINHSIYFVISFNKKLWYFENAVL